MGKKDFKERKPGTGKANRKTNFRPHHPDREFSGGKVQVQSPFGHKKGGVRKETKALVPAKEAPARFPRPKRDRKKKRTNPTTDTARKASKFQAPRKNFKNQNVISPSKSISYNNVKTN